MAEKKTTTKAKSAGKKRAGKPQLLCTAKLSDGKPCPNNSENGKVFCHWHDPKDETWRKVYERLEMSTPEERVDMVLSLIDDHPEHRLILPIRDSLDEIEAAQLYEIDLTQKTLEKKGKEFRIKNPTWISVNTNGINLDGANLQGANLEDCNLQNGDLEGANLQDANLFTANLQSADLGGANLQGTILYAANLQKTSFFASNLKYADLGFANLQDADFEGANLEGVDFKGAKLQGVDLSNAKSLYGVYFADAWLDRTRMRREQLGKAIGEELAHDYSSAKSGYLTLKQNFDELGDYDASSWAYRKERQMEKLEALQQKKYIKFFSDTIVEWLCDYGESVWRVIGWMAFLLFVVGPLLFSSLGGIVWTKELSQEYLTLTGLPEFVLWYRIYLLYTLDTFTTASFSGLQPINDAVKFASGFLAIAGIVLAGLLGFVAGNRIRRS